MNSAQPDPMRRSALFNRADVAISSPCVALSRSEEHTSELQSPCNLVCRLLLEKKKKKEQRLIKLNSVTTCNCCSARRNATVLHSIASFRRCHHNTDQLLIICTRLIDSAVRL